MLFLIDPIKCPGGTNIDLTMTNFLFLTSPIFICGIAGFVLNRTNVIMLIVAIELLLLAVLFVFILFQQTSAKKSQIYKQKKT